MSVESFLPPYPGRGLAHHVSASGEIGWVYFITGRSRSSQARRIRADGGSLIVEPTDTDAPPDELRHYRCVTRTDRGLVIGNGDHVDVIALGIDGGLKLRDVVEAIDPEPDPPILTPRIALTIGGSSAVVAVRQSGAEIERIVMATDVVSASATMVVTYGGTLRNPMGTAPIRRFDEPRSLPDFAVAIWAALDPGLRVALVAGHEGSTEPAVTLP